MADAFWAVIREQIEELKSAGSADDVIRILSQERNPYGPEHRTGSDGFFAGSGGDDTVRESLYDAGWRLHWSAASYHYVMTAPNGDMITYSEGDIDRGCQVHDDH